MNANPREKQLAQKVSDALSPPAPLYRSRQLFDPKDYDRRYGIGVEIGRRQRYALPSPDDEDVIEVQFNSEYSAEHIDMDVLEKLAKVFGSRKINIGTPEGLSEGCSTCGTNSHYRISVFIYGPFYDWVLAPERPAPVSKTQVL